MAGELQVMYDTGQTVYFMAFNGSGQVWNTSGTPAFENYATANIADYDIAATESGTASQHYKANMPALSAGDYSIIARQRAGASPAESDPIIGIQNIAWDGSAVVGLNTIDTVVDAVLVDTGTTLDGKIDSILTDTGTTLDGKIDSILADTGTDGVVLSSTTLNAIADALLDRSNGIETSYTPRQALRLILSALAAKLSGAGTTSIAIRDVGDSKDRITATVDSNGNRSSVTLDAS